MYYIGPEPWALPTDFIRVEDRFHPVNNGFLKNTGNKDNTCRQHKPSPNTGKNPDNQGYSSIKPRCFNIDQMNGKPCNDAYAGNHKQYTKQGAGNHQDIQICFFN